MVGSCVAGVTVGFLCMLEAIGLMTICAKRSPTERNNRKKLKTRRRGKQNEKPKSKRKGSDSDSSDPEFAMDSPFQRKNSFPSKHRTPQTTPRVDWTKDGRSSGDNFERGVSEGPGGDASFISRTRNPRVDRGAINGPLSPRTPRTPQTTPRVDWAKKGRSSGGNFETGVSEGPGGDASFISRTRNPRVDRGAINGPWSPRTPRSPQTSPRVDWAKNGRSYRDNFERSVSEELGGDSSFQRQSSSCRTRNCSAINRPWSPLTTPRGDWAKNGRSYRDNFERGVTEELGVMDAGWEGFSMEEALQHADQASEKIKLTTPEEVLTQLQRGNTRFWKGCCKKPKLSAFQLRALMTKQFPSVAVLSCSDSRVPIEIVFDMGLGEMFVVRVAGNALDDTTLASLQYAVHHLKVKVLLIMGHEGCGAVKAAGLPAVELAKEPLALQNLLGSLREGMDFDRLRNCRDKRVLDRESVISNVTNQLKIITCDEAIMKKVHSQELKMIGAFYELSSGIVDFFSVADVEPKESQASRGVVGHVSPTSTKVSSRRISARLLPTLNLAEVNK
eukprot:TRINITY_DN720_c1_g1_i2.p1 TRINITY_DN720_c1_g1~~TRINITY_DN720_c1_g1_i2.p1  ORF type:complete len:587 (-),score=75.88 TRINITY_DN720_c1_g1_i2:38-1714(-)